MSKRERTPDSDTRSKNLIQDRQERLEETLDVASRQTNNGTLTQEVRHELVACIEDLHRMLSKYDDEAVLSDGDIPDISPIKDRKG